MDQLATIWLGRKGRPIYTATMCSGIDVPAFTLKNIQSMLNHKFVSPDRYDVPTQFIVLFACEIDQSKRIVLAQNHFPLLLFHDAVEVASSQTALEGVGAAEHGVSRPIPRYFRLLWVSFSCKDVSSENSKRSSRGHITNMYGTSGVTFEACMTTMENYDEAAILVSENVLGLLKNIGQVKDDDEEGSYNEDDIMGLTMSAKQSPNVQKIEARAAMAGLAVLWLVTNAKHFRQPQNRPRVYLVLANARRLNLQIKDCADRLVACKEPPQRCTCNGGDLRYCINMGHIPWGSAVLARLVYGKPEPQVGR